MNILFVSAILPYPLYSGGQIRIYNLLKELSHKHTISLYSFIRNEDEKKYMKDLRFLHDVTLVKRGRGMQPKYLIPSIFGTYPLLLSTYNNSEMKNVISEALRRRTFDLIHIEPFYVYPSIPGVSVPLVVSEHNVEHEVYRSYAEKVRYPGIRQIQLYDADKLRTSETSVLKKATAVTAVSVGDAEKLKILSGRQDITVVPNGVDTDYFTFENKIFRKKKLSFVFIGNFLWIPNIDVLHTLLDDVWPVLHDANPGSELHIVGANVPDWAKHLTEKDVIIDGIIPDIRDAYRKADALIAPLGIAGGTKFKILEAFACGCPVITTREGIAGIDGNIEKCVMIASTPEEMKDAVGDMSKNERKWMTMCELARRLVETHYGWSAIARELSKVWEGAVS
jgi:glycosyltransferase involved in cell wall biosynthesis